MQNIATLPRYQSCLASPNTPCNQNTIPWRFMHKSKNTTRVFKKPENISPQEIDQYFQTVYHENACGTEQEKRIAYNSLKGRFFQKETNNPSWAKPQPATQPAEDYAEVTGTFHDPMLTSPNNTIYLSMKDSSGVCLNLGKTLSANNRFHALSLLMPNLDPNTLPTMTHNGKLVSPTLANFLQSHVFDIQQLPQPARWGIFFEIAIRNNQDPSLNEYRKRIPSFPELDPVIVELAAAHSYDTIQLLSEPYGKFPNIAHAHYIMDLRPPADSLRALFSCTNQVIESMECNKIIMQRKENSCIDQNISDPCTQNTFPYQIMLSENNDVRKYPPSSTADIRDIDNYFRNIHHFEIIASPEQKMEMYNNLTVRFFQNSPNNNDLDFPQNTDTSKLTPVDEQIGAAEVYTNAQVRSFSETSLGDIPFTRYRITPGATSLCLPVGKSLVVSNIIEAIQTLTQMPILDFLTSTVVGGKELRDAIFAKNASLEQNPNAFNNLSQPLKAQVVSYKLHSMSPQQIAQFGFAQQSSPVMRIIANMARTAGYQTIQLLREPPGISVIMDLRPRSQSIRFLESCSNVQVPQIAQPLQVPQLPQVHPESPDPFDIFNPAQPQVPQIPQNPLIPQVPQIPQIPQVVPDPEDPVGPEGPVMIPVLQASQLIPAGPLSLDIVINKIKELYRINITQVINEMTPAKTRMLKALGNNILEFEGALMQSLNSVPSWNIWNTIMYFDLYDCMTDGLLFPMQRQLTPLSLCPKYHYQNPPNTLEELRIRYNYMVKKAELHHLYYIATLPGHKITQAMQKKHPGSTQTFYQPFTPIRWPTQHNYDNLVKLIQYATNAYNTLRSAAIQAAPAQPKGAQKKMLALINQQGGLPHAVPNVSLTLPNVQYPIHPQADLSQWKKLLPQQYQKQFDVQGRTVYAASTSSASSGSGSSFSDESVESEESEESEAAEESSSSFSSSSSSPEPQKKRKAPAKRKPAPKKKK